MKDIHSKVIVAWDNAVRENMGFVPSVYFSDKLGLRTEKALNAVLREGFKSRLFVTLSTGRVIPFPAKVSVLGMEALHTTLEPLRVSVLGEGRSALAAAPVEALIGVDKEVEEAFSHYMKVLNIVDSYIKSSAFIDAPIILSLLFFLRIDPKRKEDTPGKFNMRALLATVSYIQKTSLNLPSFNAWIRRRVVNGDIIQDQHNGTILLIEGRKTDWRGPAEEFISVYSGKVNSDKSKERPGRVAGDAEQTSLPGFENGGGAGSKKGRGPGKDSAWARYGRLMKKLDTILLEVRELKSSIDRTSVKRAKRAGDK